MHPNQTTHLYAFRVHVVPFVRLRPEQPGISLRKDRESIIIENEHTDNQGPYLLVDKQVRVIHLFEIEVDWLHEVLGYVFRSLSPFLQVSGTW